MNFKRFLEARLGDPEAHDKYDREQVVNRIYAAIAHQIAVRKLDVDCWLFGGGPPGMPGVKRIDELLSKFGYDPNSGDPIKLRDALVKLKVAPPVIDSLFDLYDEGI